MDTAVGQIAKIRGCRTVGIAGGAFKASLCRDAFGYDEVIDYKSSADVEAAVRDACLGKGVDGYFDNTCGPISDAVMNCLAKGARITVCGTAAIADWAPPPLGPRVHRQLLVARARMQGFLVLDHKERYDEARHELAAWVREGKLAYREHILEGAEAARGAIRMLYDGGNQGKLLVRTD